MIDMKKGRELLYWGVDFGRSLHHLEEEQYGELLSLLSNIFLCTNSKSYRI